MYRKIFFFFFFAVYENLTQTNTVFYKQCHSALQYITDCTQSISLSLSQITHSREVTRGSLVAFCS